MSTENEKKLRALQKTFELDEQRILHERNDIDQVVDQRRRLVEEVQEQRSVLQEKLNKLRTEERAAALQTGNGQRLASTSRFEKRVEKELAEVEELVASREKELAAAVERFEATDAELVEVRIEKKKLERLLDKREFRERIRDEATQEALADEMNYYRNRRKE